MINRKLFISLGIIFCSLFVSVVSKAQEGSPTPEPSDQSPEACLGKFLKDALKEDFISAAKFITFPSSYSPTKKKEVIESVASKLNNTLSRELKLSDRPEGDLFDELSKNSELLLEGKSKDGQTLKVFLTRVQDPQTGSWSWKLPLNEASKIRKLHHSQGALITVPSEISFLKEWSVAGFSLADLVNFGVLLLVVAAVGYVLRKITISGLRIVFESQVGTFKRASYPLQLFYSILLLTQGLPFFELSFTSTMALKKILVVIGILNLLWFLYVLTSIFSELLRKKLEKEEKKLASGLVPLFQRVANVLITCLLLLYLLETLGFNVNTLLAGLGVGGIAVALASQKTIENLFGGVVLFFDHPVKVGDFGKFGDVSGIIEDIGLRSTRIRTPQRTVVSIPNAELIQRQIENFSSRDKILFHRKIGLRYETSADQLRYVIAELRKLLLSLEYVDNEPARVRFIEMGDFSLNLEIFCYFRTGDWPTYLQMQEDLLLRIMETIEKANTGFAFPSQTLYLERPEKFGAGQEDVHKIVQSWRATCSVPLPDYHQSAQEEFRDTIAFPSSDSMLHKKSGTST